MISAISSGVLGLNWALDRFSGYADAISRFGMPGLEEESGSSGISGSLVGLKEESLIARANMKVIGTSNDLLGTLLDLVG